MVCILDCASFAAFRFLFCGVVAAAVVTVAATVSHQDYYYC